MSSKGSLDRSVGGCRLSASIVALHQSRTANKKKARKVQAGHQHTAIVVKCCIHWDRSSWRIGSLRWKSLLYGGGQLTVVRGERSDRRRSMSGEEGGERMQWCLMRELAGSATVLVGCR